MGKLQRGQISGVALCELRWAKTPPVIQGEPTEENEEHKGGGGNRRAEKGMLDDGLVVSLMVALTEVEEKEDMKTRPRSIKMRHIRMRQLMWKVEVLTCIAASIGRILLAC